MYIVETVYIDEYIESDGQDAWMSASQNIERVLVVPLEVNTAIVLINVITEYCIVLGIYSFLENPRILLLLWK